MTLAPETPPGAVTPPTVLGGPQAAPDASPRTASGAAAPQDFESWLSAVGYEGHYEVSNLGRVRSVDRKVPIGSGRWRCAPGALMKLHPDDAGYLKVSLKRDGVRTVWRVHTLVASAFLVRSPWTTQVRHLDGDPANNRLSNLAWGTQSENEMDKVRHGTAAYKPREQCSRHHLLAGANLASYGSRKGRKVCLACARARSTANSSLALGKYVDVGALADEHYEKIMGAV